MSNAELIISVLRGPCGDCDGNEKNTCVRCQLEFEAADEIERLRKLTSEHKHQIHTLRQRIEWMTREMENLRAGQSSASVVRHFDGLSQEWNPE